MLKSGSILKSNSLEETLEFGRSLGRTAQINDIFCFFGDLGAGKTTCIKGLVEGALNLPSHLVTSPTFPLLNIYEGSFKVFHFDLYRIRDVQEFLNLGFEEYLNCGGLCCIEWSEKIEPLLSHFLLKKITLQVLGTFRTIEVT